MEKVSYMFLSFRNPVKNLNLGVAIVQAKSLLEAIPLSHKKKVNPGGEVLGSPMTAEMFKEEGLEKDRLYSKAEMKKLGYSIPVD